jgi:hypothetical protein
MTALSFAFFSESFNLSVDRICPHDLRVISIGVSVDLTYLQPIRCIEIVEVSLDDGTGCTPCVTNRDEGANTG